MARRSSSKTWAHRMEFGSRVNASRATRSRTATRSRWATSWCASCSCRRSEVVRRRAAVIQVRRMAGDAGLGETAVGCDHLRIIPGAGGFGDLERTVAQLVLQLEELRGEHAVDGVELALVGSAD